MREESPCKCGKTACGANLKDLKTLLRGEEVWRATFRFAAVFLRGELIKLDSNIFNASIANVMSAREIKQRLFVWGGHQVASTCSLSLCLDCSISQSMPDMRKADEEKTHLNYHPQFE